MNLFIVIHLCVALCVYILGRLHFGWSSAKSKRIDNTTTNVTTGNCWPPSQQTASRITSNESLTQDEQDRVFKVIQRAEEVSVNEQLRVG